MKVAIYAKISTNNHGQDVTMQTRELKEYIERRGWQLAGEYVDVGVIGTKEKRTHWICNLYSGFGCAARASR